MYQRKMVREVGFEPTNSYESGYLIHMTSCLYAILSPPPLTWLGNSRLTRLGCSHSALLLGTHRFFLPSVLTLQLFGIEMKSGGPRRI